MTSDSPETLSHYTNLGSFIEIVRTNCLWASNVAFLNDRSELLHALSASKSAIKILSSDAAYSDWLPVIRRTIKELEQGIIPETFVVCFCNDSDNLSQWRGYGGGTQGICIALDVKKLRRKIAAMTIGSNSQRSLKLYQVKYTKLSTGKVFGQEMLREIEGVADLDDLVGFSDDDKYAECFRRISLLLPRFKHRGFRDEREWRIVIQSPQRDGNLSFRANGNKIVPYINLSFDGGIPLKSVTIGPGHDQSFTEQSVRAFLDRYGLREIPIFRSEVPFRI